MKLNPVTNTNFARLQYYLANQELGIADGEPVPMTVAHITYLEAARDAGIIEDLPEHLASGSIINAPFMTGEKYLELVKLAREAYTYIDGVMYPDLGE